MCAIIGVSFAPNSSIDRRKLANALLTAGQVRGRDAAGYAWTSPSGDGIYKKDVPAEYLSVARIPQDATAIILHTRAATHGSPRDNDNNHPVVSPSGDIRLVHNGVIYNHDSVRRVLGKSGKRLPDVDSSVIPAVIEELGLSASDILEGDAACAWFDIETGSTIHLARFSHSPVAIAHLEDGTRVFGSTPAIVAQALTRLGLRWFGSYPDPFYVMGEGEYIQIVDGEIINESEVEWGEDAYSAYGWSRSDYRHITSGASTASSVARTPGGWGVLDDEDEDDDYEYDTPAKSDGGRAAVLSQPITARFYDGEDILPAFWVEDHDGDRDEFVSIATMTAKLRWMAQMDGEYELAGDSDGDVRWVNHFRDIGEIDLDSGEYISWVSKPNEMDDFSDMIPQYVRDGADLLRRVHS